MKHVLGLLAIAVVSAVASFALPTPRAFIGNAGQWPRHVLYGAHTADGFVWITSTGMILDHRAKDATGVPSSAQVALSVIDSPGSWYSTSTREPGMPVVSVHRPGATQSTENASRVIVHDVRPGIDLEYVWDGDHVRYNILADAGVQIPDPLFSVSGASAVRTAGTVIECSTPLGTVTMAGVVAYQNTIESSVPVWCTATDHSIGFRVDGVAASSPLTIDPIVYASSLHGEADEVITSMALDRNGNVVVGGWTTSASIDGATGDTRGGTDAFVACLTPDLKTVLAWSYLSGDSVDAVRGVAVGPEGHIWITGETNSPDLPFPSSAIRGAASGTMDGFVVRLSPDLATILSGMYIAGNDVDLPTSISVSANGEAAVCGQTASTSGMPSGPGYANSLIGQRDAFVLALSADGSRIRAFTYFGSIGDDAFLSVTHDAHSNIVVGGWTASNEYKTWPEKTLVWVPGDDERGEEGYYKEVGSNPFDVDFNGGATDGVVAKFSGNGELIFSTYFGGKDEDAVKSVFTDKNDDVHCVGQTTSSDLPLPVGSTLNYHGMQDAFFAKISKDGLRMYACGYVGGSGNDDGRCGALDADGNVVLSGSTTSPDMGSLGAGATGTPAGGTDGFLTIMASSYREFSTLVGGTGDDVVNAIALDAQGDVFLAGSSTASIPTGSQDAKGASEKVQVTSADAFAAKYAFGTVTVRNPVEGTVVCGGTPVAISWLTQDMPFSERYTVEVSGDNGATWDAVVTDIAGKNATWTVPKTAPDSGTYLVRVRTARGHAAYSADLSVGLAPEFQKQPAAAWVCPGNGQDLTVAAAGEGLRYQWYKDGVPIAGATGSSYVISSASKGDEGVYTVVVSNDCQDVTSEEAAVVVAPAPQITEQPTSASFDAGSTIDLSVTAEGPGLTYQWHHNNQPIAAPVGTQARLQIPNATVDHQGTYHCVITSDCGDATSSSATVSILTSVSEDEGTSRVLIAPQPAGDDITIMLADGMMINDVVIRDLQGQIVMQQSVGGVSSIRIPLTAAAAGVYLISVHSPNGTWVRQLVIQR